MAGRGGGEEGLPKEKEERPQTPSWVPTGADGLRSSLPNLLLLRAWGWVGGIAWGAELHPQRSLTMQSLLAQPASAGEPISLNFVPTKQKPQSTFSRM